MKSEKNARKIVRRIELFKELHQRNGKSKWKQHNFPNFELNVFSQIRTQLQKEKDRDISEKIALGLPNTGNNSGEIQFDSRLFNTSKVSWRHAISLTFTI